RGRCGASRARHPVIRAGWKVRAADAFASLSDGPWRRTRYRCDARGGGAFVRVSWDEVDAYLARGLHAIAETYSGEDGKRRLLDEDGYEPEMLEFWEHSGVRTMKFGSSLPVPRVAGKFGLVRFRTRAAPVA